MKKIEWKAARLESGYLQEGEEVVCCFPASDSFAHFADLPPQSEEFAADIHHFSSCGELLPLLQSCYSRKQLGPTSKLGKRTTACASSETLLLRSNFWEGCVC